MSAFKNIPNILSVIRILLIPIFITAYFSYDGSGVYFLPAAILLASGLTDFLDGFIARKYHLESYLGRILDPLADKLTQFTVCLVVGLEVKVFLYLAALYFIKEFCMMIAGILLTHKKIKIAGSKWWGKVGTGVFYAVMLVVVLFPNLSGNVKFYLCAAMMAMIITIFILYIPEYLKLIRTNND
jgi:cardiolipin synthase